MLVTYFLNDPIFNLLFYCHTILYWEKSYEKFSHNLTLDVQISGKFQRFNAINEIKKILKNSWISKEFNKNEKL